MEQQNIDIITEPFQRQTAKYNKSSICLQMDWDRKKHLRAPKKKSV